MNFNAVFLLTLVCLCLAGRDASAAPPPPGIVRLSDTTIDAAALNFPTGQYGTCINGQTYQQEALVTFGDRQYATWFADGGGLCVARRALPDGKWEVIRFADYRIKHTDAHNVAVLGICPDDGTIHLAFDHHVSRLHYRRSVPGVALKPADFTWEASIFGGITSELEPGKPLERVTYPQFFSTPQGKLQLVYRIGSSGAGDWLLAEYDAQGWRLLGELFSGRGTFGSSESRCAYPNPFRYGPGDRLHATWCWRERPKEFPADLTANHGVHYAFSDDFGRTWKNNDGAVVGVLNAKEPQSISIASPGIQVWDVPIRRGLMNTTTQFADTRGRVHVINWQLPTEARAPDLDLNHWRYMHYWRETDGKWHENQLPFFGRKPQIVFDPDGNAFIVFCKGSNLNYHRQDPGGDLCIATASEKSRWTDWRIVHEQGETFVGEPLVDVARWRAGRILSIYIQSAPGTPGAPSPLRVIDFTAK